MVNWNWLMNIKNWSCTFTKYYSFFDLYIKSMLASLGPLYYTRRNKKFLHVHSHFAHLLFPYPIKISFNSFPHQSSQIQVIKNAYQHFPTWKVDTLHFILQFRMELSPCFHLFSCWQRMLNSLSVLTNILMFCFSSHFFSAVFSCSSALKTKLWIRWQQMNK